MAKLSPGFRLGAPLAVPGSDRRSSLDSLADAARMQILERPGPLQRPIPAVSSGFAPRVTHSGFQQMAKSGILDYIMRIIPIATIPLRAPGLIRDAMLVRLSSGDNGDGGGLAADLPLVATAQ